MVKETRGRKKLPSNIKRKFNLNCRLNLEKNSILKRVPGRTKTAKIELLLEFWDEYNGQKL